MRLDVYLNYPGNFEQAFLYYEQQQGGTISGLMRHGEMPESPVPADWQHAILHARLEIGNATLMGADIPGAQPMRSAYVALTVDSAEETERIYRVLSEGGEVFMKMEQTFFAKRFAMLRDRFGTSWMLLHGVEGVRDAGK
jgi:PhnB protein